MVMRPFRGYVVIQGGGGGAKPAPAAPQAPATTGQDAQRLSSRELRDQIREQVRTSIQAATQAEAEAGASSVHRMAAPMTRHTGGRESVARMFHLLRIEGPAVVGVGARRSYPRGQRRRLNTGQ